MLNCTFLQPPYPAFQAYLRTVLIVPLVLLGLAANSLNILIFTNAQMRSSMVNWFLLAMAVSDQFVLVSTFFMLTFPIFTEISLNIAMNDAAVNLIIFFFPLGQAAQSCTVYLTVGVSIFRYIGVCHPLKAQVWITPRRVKCALGGVIVFSILFTTPRWLELTKIKCHSSIFNSTSIRIIHSNFALHPLHFVGYAVYAYTTVMFLIPFALLLFVNISIIIALRRSNKLRKQLTQQESKRLKPSKRGRRSGTGGGGGGILLTLARIPASFFL